MPISSLESMLSPSLTLTSSKPEYTVKNSPWFIKTAFPSPLIKNILEILPSKTERIIAFLFVAIFIPLLKVSIFPNTLCFCFPYF